MQGAAGKDCSQRPTKMLQCSCENVPAGDDGGAPGRIYDAVGDYSRPI